MKLKMMTEKPFEKSLYRFLTVKKWKMKMVKSFVLFFLGIIVLSGLIFFASNEKRISTIQSIHKLAQFDDGFEIYEMTVKYDYNLENIMNGEIHDDSDFAKSVLHEALPGFDIKVQTPKFGCSAFCSEVCEGGFRMGRNYDFRFNTSAMIVHTHPKNCYSSVGVADLNNIKALDISKNIKSKIKAIVSPFIILDGINEKGVSIAVLMTDSPSTHQDNGKHDITTTLAIRLVLDKAASTKEAVELLSEYDMYAVAGGDYHFYIADSYGDGCVVDYDPLSEKREMIVTKIPAVTNFYSRYADFVKPNQRNGIYGHGKERYNVIMQVLNQNQSQMTELLCWDALKASAQTEKPGDITSNTQWSVLYNNSDCSMKFVLRRHWDEVYTFSPILP